MSGESGQYEDLNCCQRPVHEKTEDVANLQGYVGLMVQQVSVILERCLLSSY